MTGPARSLFGRALFANKGDAAPAAAAPTAPRPPLPAGLIRPGETPASPPPPGRRTASPLSFLITRRAPCGVADRPVIAPIGPTRPPHASPTAADGPGRRVRRALTLRLDMPDYLRFRACVARRDATFQSVLEKLVLGFLVAPRSADDGSDDD